MFATSNTAANNIPYNFNAHFKHCAVANIEAPLDWSKQFIGNEEAVSLFKNFMDALYTCDFDCVADQMEPAFLELAQKRVQSAHKTCSGEWKLQNFKKWHETEFYLYNVQSFLLSGVDVDRRKNKPDTEYGIAEDVKYKVGD